MAATVLIVDDEEHFRLHAGSYLEQRGYEIIHAANMQQARTCIAQGKADIILLDVQLPDGYGPNLLDETAHLPVRPPIILITGYGDIDMAVDAMKNGAHDFLQKPIKLAQMEKSVQRAREIVSMRRELAHIHHTRQESLDFVIGSGEQMKILMERTRRAAAACKSVLIVGETGTGKEVLANAIQQYGPRASKPFVAINCAAIQPTVLESELFGYEVGAFTGAEKRKHGLAETADGGILFLDEISSMPVEMQAKLLRFLEQQEFRRVGGNNLIKVDVQVLAASNRHLPTLIQEGKFREDLYYRLRVVDLDLPPLRERKQDIPELVGLFIRKINPRMGVNITDITPKALEALMAHRWPGNIRELRNVIESAMLFCDNPVIDINDLPMEIVRCLIPA
jgi:DNA-binding NtrC family response regulator